MKANLTQLIPALVAGALWWPAMPAHAAGAEAAEATENAAETAGPAAKDVGGKKKKKKKKDSGGGGVENPADVVTGRNGKPVDPALVSQGDWCVWLADSPGTLLDRPENPWLHQLRIGGRLHYQASYVDGRDVNGRDFNDTYDEYRRFRLETRARFLRFFKMDLDLNLVDDRRYRIPPENELEWGYDDFDTALLELDLLAAADGLPLDKLRLAYGKMKMAVTEEQKQSSREIHTIERSMLAKKLVGEESRPTGLEVSLAKGDWSGRLGYFSGEDDAEFVGGWNDGRTQFVSVCWQPDRDFNLTLDYVNTLRSGEDDALGYRSAVVLGSTYDKRHCGIQASLIHGDNGFGDPADRPRNRANRQGDFHGLTVMPWYWILEDRLQLVYRYEYAGSEESEGLRLDTRYLRGRHDDLRVEVNGGRGDRYQAHYLGLNYFLCGHHAKIMGGVLMENLETPDGDLDGTTWTLAFRTFF